PKQFPNPNQLDVTYQHKRSLVFGTGIHTCFGERLARLETELLLRSMIEHLSNMQLSRKPIREKSILLRSLREIWVKF
ncbi:MAG: cytochrome P450, partial [Chloroflexota bacterium]